MKKTPLSKKINKYVEKNVSKIFWYGLLAVVLALGLQVFFYLNESIESEDMVLQYHTWTEECEGENYTAEDKVFFCQECYNGSREECVWPLDMNITFNGLEDIRASKAEIHCLFIVDGINKMDEKGEYFGIEENPFFTWQMLDPRESHEIVMCCGIERQIFISALLGISKKWPQACINFTADPYCTK